MSNCVGGYSKRIVVQIILVNNTRQLIPITKYTPCPVPAGPIVAAVFLTLIFIAAVSLSLMVLVTISTSYTLKKYLYSQILINICSAVIVDCILNLTIAIAYVSTAPWAFGYNICYVNSFFMLLMTSEMILTIILLAFDRLFVLKKFAPYLRLSRSKLSIVILLTWVVSAAVAVPLLAGFTSMPYKSRYSCTVSDPRDDFYLIAPLAVIVVIPAFALVVIIAVTVSIFSKERKKHKKVKSGQSYSYLDQILMTPYFRNEIYSSICMVVLIIAYLILWLPYSALITVNPIVTADWTNKTFGDTYDIQTHAAEADSNTVLKDTAFHNETHDKAGQVMTRNLTTHVNSIPEILDGAVYETVFIWFRFIFDLLVPIIILVTLKEIRLKCESLIFCCRPSSVDMNSPKLVSPPYQNKAPKSSGFADLQHTHKKKNDNKNMVSFKTPVLFATDEGLHIRTVEDTYLDMNDPKPFLGFAKNQNTDPKFCYEVCDIVLPDEELTDFEGQFNIDEDIVPTEEYVQPDAHIDNELSFTDSVLVGANAVLMSRNSEHSDEDKLSPAEKEKYLREMEELQKQRQAAEEKFDETIELDVDKPQKVKKKVRFDTENLIQKISRPNTAESTDIEDTSSVKSTDSGVFADNEIDQEEDNSLPRFSNRPLNVDIGKIKSRPKRIIHNIRNPTTISLNKRNNGFNRLNKQAKKPARNQVGNFEEHDDDFDPNSKKHKRNSGVPKIHNVKSRYMDHYRSNNGSAASVNSTNPAART